MAISLAALETGRHHTSLMNEVQGIGLVSVFSVFKPETCNVSI